MFKQKQKQITAYEKTTIHNNFCHTINWLEKYIEMPDITLIEKAENKFTMIV